MPSVSLHFLLRAKGLKQAAWQGLGSQTGLLEAQCDCSEEKGQEGGECHGPLEVPLTPPPCSSSPSPSTLTLAQATNPSDTGSRGWGGASGAAGLN